MTEYERRVIAVIVAPYNEPTYSDQATTVAIADESGGEYIEVSQRRADAGMIAINPEEWPRLRKAIDDMIASCRANPGGKQ